MKKHISIIAMTSSMCNIDCCYCYMKASRKNMGAFPIDAIPRLIRNSSMGFDSVEFCWHGGEPLLVGKGFYERIIQSQNELSESEGIEFRNTMQTNGILIDKEWISLLKKMHISFGFSFDAPPEVDLLHRGESGDKVIEAWKLAQEAGLKAGVICVVSKHNVNKAEEIFDFFLAHNINSYSFLPLRTVPACNLPPLPTNQEIFDLFRTTFELWLSRKNDFVSIDPLSSMIRGLLGGNPQSCSFSASCLKNMISVDQTGDVVPCCSLVEDGFIMGNILNEPLVDIMNRGKGPFVELRENSIKNFCHNCEYLPFCNGGCRADAYWASGHFDGPYPYCEARKSTFEYLKFRLKELGALT